jgi:ribosomal protein S8E
MLLFTSSDSGIPDDQENEPMVQERRGAKGRKRSAGGRGSRGRNKRQRIEEESEPQTQPVSQESTVQPDAGLVLKYTYGVNAWKHWVLQKNQQLEKALKQNHRIKLFKTDILQCTADELNYTLCLFVKEVRKPNGEEYAPDSIYYLCLGRCDFILSGWKYVLFSGHFISCSGDIQVPFKETFI